MLLDIVSFAAIGFFAQLVDGALGMAYGVISTTFLLNAGLPPAVASAAVHTSEVFTTGASGLSHLFHRNVDWTLFRRLAPAGIAGGVLGAYVLTQLPGEVMRPVVSAYLGLMGAVILFKAFRYRILPTPRARGVVPLGVAGGFIDAVGGGGWGPVVVSTLVGQGQVPRYAIGSVNLAEFFVTLSVSAAFFAVIGLQHGTAVLGLILGGIAAAPLGAYLVRIVPPRPMMAAVGLLISAISAVQVIRALG